MDPRIRVLRTEFWESQWNLAKRISTIKISKGNLSKWNEFWDYMSSIYEEIEQNNEELIDRVINLMEEEKLFSKSTRVLEIGAGTGSFTIPLSKRVKQIVAIDSSRGMLDKLENRLKEFKISNVRTLHEKWENVIINKEFDFVFAAFCPAVNNKERLFKMKDASKGYACLINISRHDDQLKMRNDLWRILTGSEFVSESYHVIYPFGILYSSGFRPQLINLAISNIVERDFAKLQKQFELYFSIFFPLTEVHKTKISDFLQKISIGGRILLKNVSEIYLLWW